MPFKDNDEQRVMHSESDNVKIIIYDKEDEVIAEIFQSLRSRYQIALVTSIKGSNFIFDCVRILYYKCHEINSERGGSCIDSPDRIKNKKATVNPINKKDNKFFQ